jgi:hypothetical protein
MCIAIFKPKHRNIDKEILENCFDNNSDGAGFAYAEDGNLVISKGFFTFDDFWAEYENLPENVPAVIHFRIGTSGKKDSFNCHPWAVNDDLCLIHNGVIGEFSAKDSPQSDTGNFTDHFVRPLVEKFGEGAIKDELFRYIVYKAIGDHNKIIFFDREGEFSIINEEEGEWNDDVWFSNTSYKVSRKKSNVNVICVTGCESSKQGKFGGAKVRYGYIDAETKELLTEREIARIVKKYKTKAKHLATRGILERVEITDTFLKYGGDDEEAYNKHWLQRMGRGQTPLEGSIIKS